MPDAEWSAGDYQSGQRLCGIASCRGHPSLTLLFASQECPLISVNNGYNYCAENKHALRVANDWKAQGYTGKHLARDLRAADYTRATEFEWHGDRSSEVHVDLSPTAYQIEQDKSLSEDLRDRREQGRIADLWTTEIIANAMAEQESEWAQEQLDYKPGRPELGSGDGALCCLLHPPYHRVLGAHRWGVLHLMDLGSSRGSGEVVDRFLRLLTGCTPTTRVYKCKMKSVKEWRTPSEHTDLQRLQVASCPCGNGLQDSAHVLWCSHTLAETIRTNVLTIANEIIQLEQAALPMEWEADVAHIPPSDRGRFKTKTLFIEAASLHASELHDWLCSSYLKRLLRTLGSSDTYLWDQTRARLVSSCMLEWSRVECLWDEINK